MQKIKPHTPTILMRYLFALIFSKIHTLYIIIYNIHILLNYRQITLVINWLTLWHSYRYAIVFPCRLEWRALCVYVLRTPIAPRTWVRCPGAAPRACERGPGERHFPPWCAHTVRPSSVDYRPERSSVFAALVPEHTTHDEIKIIEHAAHTILHIYYNIIWETKANRRVNARSTRRDQHIIV